MEREPETRKEEKLSSFFFPFSRAVQPGSEESTQTTVIDKTQAQRIATYPQQPPPSIGSILEQGKRLLTRHDSSRSSAHKHQAAMYVRTRPRRVAPPGIGSPAIPSHPPVWRLLLPFFSKVQAGSVLRRDRRRGARLQLGKRQPMAVAWSLGGEGLPDASARHPALRLGQSGTSASPFPYPMALDQTQRVAQNRVWCCAALYSDAQFLRASSGLASHMSR